jgi:heme-degrading monooxygenase HmoA
VSVILINSFEVAPGREDDFLAAWTAVAEHLARVPGYVATRLHRAVGPNAEFAFVNVGEWASPADFQAATTSDDFGRLAAGLAEFRAHPSLYQVAYEHHR